VNIKLIPHYFPIVKLSRKKDKKPNAFSNTSPEMSGMVISYAINFVYNMVAKIGNIFEKCFF
jgi:hypothetical protein